QGSADQHDHVALGREAPRQSDRGRCQRLSRQAVSGKPARGRDRGLARQGALEMTDAMAQASAHANRQRELYSLLIPLKGERLLVPRMCVAEVIAFVETEGERDAETPGWYLGTIEWNGRRIPVVTLDGPETEPRRPKRSRTRVVVFHALTSA